MRSPPKPLFGLHEIAGQYDLIICDLWGVLHDGRDAFPAAADALRQARERGALVALASNSPQLRGIIARAIGKKGIKAGVQYDGLITSGQISHDLLRRDFAGKRVFLLGPDDDAPTINGLSIIRTYEPLDADVLLATGLLFETVAAHRPMLAAAAAAGIQMICANPDRVVRHAGAWQVCAGAVADLYGELGGVVCWLGKPAAAPFSAAQAVFAGITGAPAALARTLMIGDGLMTDIQGANAIGIASLLITSGIHSVELDRGETLDSLIRRHDATPDYTMADLVW